MIQTDIRLKKIQPSKPDEMKGTPPRARSTGDLKNHKNFNPSQNQKTNITPEDKLTKNKKTPVSLPCLPKFCSDIVNFLHVDK